MVQFGNGVENLKKDEFMLMMKEGKEERPWLLMMLLKGYTGWFESVVVSQLLNFLLIFLKFLGLLFVIFLLRTLGIGISVFGGFPNNSQMSTRLEECPEDAAALTQNLLHEFGWEVLDHPPYSPDLALSDYHLFIEDVYKRQQIDFKILIKF